MFRVCKLTIAALEVTLMHFINGTYTAAIPFYRMLGSSMETLETRAQTLTRMLNEQKGVSTQIVDDIAYVGSGSLPDEGIPTKVVRMQFDKGLTGIGSTEEMSTKLRLGLTSVFCRVHSDWLYCDMRTLFDGQETEIADSIRSIVKETR